MGHRRVAVIIGGRRRPADERRRAVEDVFAAEGQLASFAGPFTIAHGTNATNEA